jgi:TonB family protein
LTAASPSSDQTRDFGTATVAVGDVNPSRGALLFALLFAPRALAQPHLEPPRRLDTAQVPYPADGHGNASVELTLVVDADGRVRDVQVVRGEPPFAPAAELGVKSFRFVPATRDGLPLAARITAVIEFHEPTVAARSAPSASAPGSAAAVPAATSRSAPPEQGTTATSEVVVHGRAREPGSDHIAPGDARFVPGAFGDPFRVIEALPGMAPWVSGLPYYFVRGSTPENVGYFIDGISVPLLFHAGAGPSIIAPALVDSVDLYAGVPPARYGRYAGAVVAGETTEPETDHAHAEFAARVFDARAFGETPYDGGRGSVMAAARYGYTDLVISLVAPKYRVKYWDYQTRATHRTWGRDTVSVFAFGARDELDYLGQKTFHVEFHRVDLRYDHPYADGDVRVGLTLGLDDSFTALQTPTGAGASATLRGPSTRLHLDWEHSLGTEVRLRAGADAGIHRFERDSFVGVNQSPHTDLEAGIYVDGVFRPSDRVELVPGMRFDAYRTRGKNVFAPEPRLTSRVLLAPRLAWISTFGVLHQEPTEEIFVPAKLPDPIDEASRDAFHLSEGVEVALPWSVRSRVTGFVSRLVARGFSGAQASRGLELFFLRSFLERLNGLVSYTLSHSETELARTSHVSLWDRTHLLTLALGYDFGAGWHAGARFFFESGRLAAVSCPTPDCAPHELGPESFLVTRRLPSFYRLDARVERRLTFGEGRWLSFTWECFNALARAEPIGYDYAPSTGLTVRKQAALIFPSFGIEGGL